MDAPCRGGGAALRRQKVPPLHPTPHAEAGGPEDPPEAKRLHRRWL